MSAQDSKTPFISGLEDVIKSAAQSHAAAYQQRQELVGAVPLGSEHLDTAEKATEYLPDYYTRAGSAGPIAQGYWSEIIDKYGLVGADKWLKDMGSLQADPRTWHTGITASSPAQQAQVRAARQDGTHSTVMPTKGVLP